MSYKEHLMSIFDVFSRRQRSHNRSCEPDDISEQLRKRILLLYRDVVSGQWRRAGNYTFEFWAQMHNSLEHLYGRPKLYERTGGNHVDDALAFLLNCDTNEFFDFIELSFKLELTSRVMGDEAHVVDAINEVFRVENAPYQLTQIVRIEEKKGSFTTVRTSAYPQVIRAEDQAIYSEAVAPALSALGAPHFESANAEFRNAMDEYRKGHYADCLTKCGSAFESVLKILCKRNNWPFSARDTAAPLLKVVINNSSLDTFFEQPLMLIATIRNRLSSSHGAGSHLRSVERHIGQYAVSSTAAAIVLLVHETDK